MKNSNGNPPFLWRQSSGLLKSDVGGCNNPTIKKYLHGSAAPLAD
jgi:hypothetical protein